MRYSGVDKNTDSTLLQQLGKLLDKMRSPSAADVINPAEASVLKY